jgi:hypothetical protein
MIKSTTRVGHLADIFRYTDEDEKQMQVQLARICVLYDDLMLEHAGADEESIGVLDRSGLNGRRFYFVRRQLGTLSELRSAICVLNGNKSFKKRKEAWPSAHQNGWNKSVSFFEANHKFLKDWRNDVGGHFLDAAAAFAIDNVEAETVGVIEIYRRGSGADVRMKFAYDLVAVAMTKNQKNNQSVEEFLEKAFTFLLEAMKASVDALQILATNEIFRRFG